MSVGGPPVTVVENGLGLPVTNSTTTGSPFTVVDSGGMAVQVVERGGLPVHLLNPDGSDWSDVQIVGGIAIGAIAQPIPGDGDYVMSWGTDFNSLDVIAPHLPRGKFLMSREYGQGGRGEDTLLACMYDTDPFHTGHNDSNRGKPVGYDNMSVANSVLTLQARIATAAERLHFQGVGRYLIASMISTCGAAAFYPDAEGTGDIVIQARIRRTGGVLGNHQTEWTYSGQPMNSIAGKTGDEHDFESNGASAAVVNHVAHGGAGTGDTSIDGYVFNYDGQFHIGAIKLNKSALAGFKFYLDGVLKATRTATGNAADKFMRYLLTGHADTTGNEAGWLAVPAGCKLEIDWIQLFRRPGQPHYRPLIYVPDRNIDFGGNTTFEFPDKLTMWGDADVTEYFEAVMQEENEPGGNHSSNYNQFPTGVSYNSGARTLSVAPTSTKAGRLNFMGHAYKPGCTMEPVRFAVNVGPKINAATIEYEVGVPFSFDLYAACDCGVLVTDGVGCVKGIEVTGLPAWATYTPQGYLDGLDVPNSGRIHGSNPTDTGTSVLTVTVVNSENQQTVGTMDLEKAAEEVASFTTSFVAANGPLEDAGLGFTRVDGIAGGATVESNACRFVDTGAQGTAYWTPQLVAGNYAIEARFANSVSGFVCLRLTNNSNYIGMRRNGSNFIEIFKCVGGTLTLQARTSVTVTSTNVVQLAEPSANVLTIKKDGVDMALSTGDLTVESGPAAIAKQGIVPRSVATNPALIVVSTLTV